MLSIPQSDRLFHEWLRQMDNGIVVQPGNHSADQKVEKLKLCVFGSPKAGTPLMLAAPSIALPLKILVSEDGQGRAWLPITVQSI